TNIDVEFALRDNPETPAVPPQKMHCSVMAYDVIKKAAAEYKGVDIDSFEEEQIICECARVSLATLKEVIRINDLKTVEEITDYTKAGAFCKSCIRPGGHEEKDIYLVDVLRDVRAEMEQEKLKNAANASAAGTISFSEMTLVQRIKAIDSVLDEDIRPMLVMDGGNMEIIDIKENLPHYDLYIRYLGSCSGCASGSTGTLYAIESILQQKIDDNIRVLPI
ncbi:NifU family protein, partial [Aliarcobacter butzleri]|nr:NifU family protein [Aliarcobacter butzleri]